MNIIIDMWRFAELCSHDDQGSFIKDHLLSMDKYVIFTPMKNDTDYGYIAEFEDRIIICFRGTSGLEAWLTDFKPYPLDSDNQCSRGYIHDGFYDAWANFKPVIDQYFRDSLGLSSSDFSLCSKQVFITGHSRGGALASLCARHFAKNRKLSVRLVSFGSPAQGTEQYQIECDSLPIQHSRIVNHRDIVPTLPPHALGFRHWGALNLMNYEIHYDFNPLIVDSVYDHAYSRYTDSLISYCKARGNKEELVLMQEVRKRVTI